MMNDEISLLMSRYIYAYMGLRWNFMGCNRLGGMGVGSMGVGSMGLAHGLRSHLR